MPWQKIFIIVVFIAVLYNLGAAAYHMTSGKGQASGATVRSLTWRIGLSVGLIALVGLGLYTGVLQPGSGGIRVGH